MKEFFKKYINGTEIPDYNAIFGELGLGVQSVSMPQVSLGATLTQSGGKLTVSRVRTNSSAENSGLSAKDEIIGCNGYRVNQSDFEKVINSLSVGETMNLLISRDDVLYELVIKMENYESPRFDFKPLNDNSKLELFEYWLRKD